MKILIAEDNQLNQQLMLMYMSRLGWDCSIAENGMVACELLQAEKFDVILMDVDMPVLDGIEATRFIRVHDKNIPIIAITAYADEQMRSNCAEAGMNAFLAKPVSRSEIKDIVLEYVNCNKL